MEGSGLLFGNEWKLEYSLKISQGRELEWEKSLIYGIVGFNVPLDTL